MCFDAANYTYPLYIYIYKHIFIYVYILYIYIYAGAGHSTLISVSDVIGIAKDAGSKSMLNSQNVLQT